jgi:hypothetical protein
MRPMRRACSFVPDGTPQHFRVPTDRSVGYFLSPFRVGKFGDCAKSSAEPPLVYPTLPSKLTPNSFCASTANSIGNSRNTSLQNPFTIILTASCVEIPRWLQ